MSDPVWAIAIHGGSGPSYKDDYSDVSSSMKKILEAARRDLRKGASALDVVQEAVHELEDSGLHIAGRGSSPNTKGKWEQDAAIMDGSNRRAGAVAGELQLGDRAGEARRHGGGVDRDAGGLSGGVLHRAHDVESVDDDPDRLVERPTRPAQGASVHHLGGAAAQLADP